MAPGKSVFQRLALKKKVALARKQQAVKTLQEELDRTTDVRDQIAEFLRALCTDARDDRDHPFVAQVGAKVVIVVIVGCHLNRVLDRPDRAPARHLCG